MKKTSALLTLVLAGAVAGFGQTTSLLDPIGFCPPPATAGTCTTATGIGGESIGLGTNPTSFGMYKNGNGGGTSTDPWYLIVAVPDVNGTHPAITSGDGAFGAPTFQDAGDWANGSALDLYKFAALTQPLIVNADASMNSANLFGANEVAALGSTPTFFDVLIYSFSPGIQNNTPYLFNVGGSGLANGTWLAGSAGSQPFSTPFTTAGLANGPGGPGGGGGGGPVVPEPSSLVLFGSAILGTAALLKKRISARS